MKGVIMLGVTALVSLWLGLTGRLGLYVHPRYIIFTTILSAIALVMVILGAKYGIEQLETDKPRPAVAMASAVACGLVAVCLLAVKPATLTSATANQRGINSASVSDNSGAAQLSVSPLFTSDDYSNLTVKDWAGLLSQTTDPGFFTGKQADISGFVAADQNDPKNVFYVSRFVVTCCVVDARPLGVAVYAPGWQSKYPADSWVRVSGKFVANPSSSNLELVAIEPDAISSISRPDNPYEN